MRCLFVFLILWRIWSFSFYRLRFFTSLLRSAAIYSYFFLLLLLLFRFSLFSTFMYTILFFITWDHVFHLRCDLMNISSCVPINACPYSVHTIRLQKQLVHQPAAWLAIMCVYVVEWGQTDKPQQLWKTRIKQRTERKGEERLLIQQ